MKLEYAMLIALIVSVTIIGLTHISAEMNITFDQLADLLHLNDGNSPDTAGGPPAGADAGKTAE